MMFGLSFLVAPLYVSSIGYIVASYGETISGIRYYIPSVAATMGDAYGVKANGGLRLQSALGLGRGVFRVDEIVGENNSYGFYTSRKSNNNTITHKLNGGKISLGKIVANTQNAYGFYNAGDTVFDLEQNFFSDYRAELLSERIFSVQGDAFGIYQASQTGTFNVDRSRIDLGVIEAKNNAYGVYAQTGSQIYINLTKSSMRFGLKGNTTQAFGGGGRIEVSLSESDLLIDGNGGKIDVLRMESSFSSNTIGFYNPATTQRKLEIAEWRGNGDARLRFSIDAQKGIADQIIVHQTPAVYFGDPLDDIKIDLNYYGTFRPNQWVARNQRLVLFEVQDEKLRNTPLMKSVKSTEGFVDIFTPIYFDNIASAPSGFQAYIDLNVSPSTALSYENAIKPTFLAMTGIYSAYFGMLNSLNQRMGELKNNPSSSGMWIRAEFGGEGFMPLDYYLHYGQLHLGGDIHKASLDANHYFGASFSLLGSFDDSYSLNSVNGYKLSGYYVLSAKDGFYTDTQININYLTSMTRPSNGIKEFDFSDIMLGVSEEVGARIGGKRGGFYFEPSALVHLGYQMPTSFTQIKQDQRLQVKVDDALLLQSRLGGKVGFNITKSGVSIVDLFAGGFLSIDYLASKTMRFDLKDWMEETYFIPNKVDFGFLFTCGLNADISKNFKLYTNLDAGVSGGFFEAYKFDIGLRISL